MLPTLLYTVKGHGDCCSKDEGCVPRKCSTTIQVENPCSISNISNRSIADIDLEFFYLIGVVPVKRRAFLVEKQTV